MQKPPREVIHIHDTQSQSQEYHAPPGPRATWQSLSRPFARTRSDISQSSVSYQHGHNLMSSQPTEHSMDPLAEYNLDPLPSQPDLSSQNDLSRIPEPLAMTLEYIPRKRSTENLPDLDKMEEMDELEVQTWKAEIKGKPRR
jgi:hypothetical protein